MILPRFIRFRDAPSYLGMDKDRFNAEVRPHLVDIQIGKQGVAAQVSLHSFVPRPKKCESPGGGM